MNDINYDGEIAVSVQDISKCYLIYSRPQNRLKQILWRGRRKFYNEFWALKGISFNVKKGETVGIVGRNGSGKSTLLQIIAGTLNPTAGEVKVKGRIAALLELGSGFNPEFTGRENIFINGSILGISREEMRARLDDIIAFADIGDFIDQPVKIYSSGMYVRLAFSVQALIEPDVLIVDEALAVGDEKFQRKCYSFIDHLRKKGTSILVVTHSLSLIEKFCQRAILLESGEIHGIGQSKEIIDQYHALLYADEKTYLRLLNKAGLNSPAYAAGLPEIPEAAEKAAGADSEKKPEKNSKVKLRAFIKDVWVCDVTGKKRELFGAHEHAEIGFKVEVFDDIKHMMAGIRLKTVEGIEVYGTSTEYSGNSLRCVKKNTVIVFKFKISLSLCEGTYFISAAVAEKADLNGMQYLDKRSDVVIFKVIEKKITATGIAHLNAKIDHYCEALEK